MALVDAAIDRRKRDEHQIRIGGSFARAWFDDALAACIRRHPGLSFFTDEQIAEIRAEMIKRDWFRHNLNRRNRKREAA